MIGWMDGTKKKLVVIGLLTVVLVAGMSALGMKIYQNNQASRDEEFAKTLKINEPGGVTGVQKNGNYNYDTTEYKAMFVIEGVDANSKTMSLKFIFPSKLRDNIITSKVACGRGETWIFSSQDDIVVPAEKTVYEEERIIPGKTIMQGKCSDQYCRAIRRYCEVWL